MRVRPHSRSRPFTGPATGPSVAASRARAHQVIGGPAEALSLAAIGHVEDRPALIDRAAELLALHWELSPDVVRRALDDPALVREALENAAPEGAALIYGPGSD